MIPKLLSGSFPVKKNAFQRAVEDCLHAAGYEIQLCKGWRVSRSSERPRITGLVLTGNGRVAVPWVWRWRLWCWRWKSWLFADDVTTARFNGYKGLVGMVK